MLRGQDQGLCWGRAGFLVVLRLWYRHSCCLWCLLGLKWGALVLEFCFKPSRSDTFYSLSEISSSVPSEAECCYIHKHSFVTALAVMVIVTPAVLLFPGPWDVQCRATSRDQCYLPSGWIPILFLAGTASEHMTSILSSGNIGHNLPLPHLCEVVPPFLLSS